MGEKLLEINNLKAAVEGKEILKGINLQVKKGEIHIIMGPNGAGKSTLANVIMGAPTYEITAGDLIYQGEQINELEVDKRARKGIFLSFQYPEEIRVLVSRISSVPPGPQLLVKSRESFSSGKFCWIRWLCWTSKRNMPAVI